MTKRKPSGSKLSERGVLARITIRTWTGRARDAELTKSVVDSLKDESIGYFVRTLVDKSVLDEMTATVKRIRRQLEDQTLPWGGEGVRLLPAKNWGAFKLTLSGLRQEFNASVDEFVSQYNNYVRTQRKALGSAFDASMYPTEAYLRDRFELSVEYLPLPDGQDFESLAVPARDRGYLQKDLNEATIELLDDSVRDYKARIADLATRLRDQIVNGRYSVRRNTFDRLKTMVDGIPIFNLSDDEDLAGLHPKLDSVVTGVDPDDLRNDASSKERAVAALDETIDKLGYLLDDTRSEARRTEAEV